ncbi:DUF1801 domain-containing protein [Pseudonocardia dioxanivorans]|nr:DUF1801 domain-containing protein [Pseudonocardia dioxanivorans]
MSEPGTPQEYIDTLAEPRRGDIAALDALIREAAPDLEPVLAGRMLGYGPFHYRYASGREGDATLIALASRKRYISVYVLCSTEGAYLAERYAPRLTGRRSGSRACGSHAPPPSTPRSCGSSWGGGPARPGRCHDRRTCVIPGPHLTARDRAGRARTRGSRVTAWNSPVPHSGFHRPSEIVPWY